LYRRVPLLQKLVRGTVYTYREGYLALLAHLTWLLPIVQLIAKARLRRQVPDPLHGTSSSTTSNFSF